jgi:hypothetical protein
MFEYRHAEVIVMAGAAAGPWGIRVAFHGARCIDT